MATRGVLWGRGKEVGVGDLLVLWDVDGTLLNAGGIGNDLYETVFAHLFGCSLEAHPPMAGRTDRAIILETLERAGIPQPRRYVDHFIWGLNERAGSVQEAIAARGHALSGAVTALAALAAAQLREAVQPTLAGVGARAGIPVPGGYGGPGRARSAGKPGRVRQTVLTGNVRKLAEVKLAALGLKSGLDLCIGAYGDDHEERTELVHVARRRAAAVHGRLPGDFDGPATVVIGDTPLDIEAALAADARAVGVATGRYRAAQLAAAGAHAVLPDLSDTRLVMETVLP